MLANTGELFEKYAPESVLIWVGQNIWTTVIIVGVLAFLFFRDVIKNEENCVLARILKLFGIEWNERETRWGSSVSKGTPTDTSDFTEPF